MKIIDLVQCTPEWHTHRNTHWNASDAPAMIGVSKYETRQQLIARLATGLKQEVDAHTQKRFDKGHELEDKARVLAEVIVGEMLSPVVGVEGKYSASFDGITFGQEIIFEHKTLNNELEELFKSGGEIVLPEMYRVQMEHQLMVSGAERCLFMASKDAPDGGIIEFHCWYYPDPVLRERIVAGWNQLEKDIAAYVPEQKTEEAIAKPVTQLPAPAIVVKGEVVHSTLMEICPMFDAFLGNIKFDLATDQDFADGDAVAKSCRDTAKNLKQTVKNIVSQMATVNDVISSLDGYAAKFDAAGLKLEKLVKEQKELIKQNAIMKARKEFADYLADKSKLFASFNLALGVTAPDFVEAIKGVKTIAGMNNKIHVALTQGKISVDMVADACAMKMEYIAEAAKGYEEEIQIPSIIFNDIEYIKLYVKTRIDAVNERKAKIAQEIQDEIDRKKADSANALQGVSQTKGESASSGSQSDEKEQDALAVSIRTETEHGVSSASVGAIGIHSSIQPDTAIVSAFMKTRDFGELEHKIRAVLVEFVKFSNAQVKRAA